MRKAAVPRPFLVALVFRPLHPFCFGLCLLVGMATASYADELLGEGDLHEVINAILDAKYKAFYLGVALKLPRGEINVICDNYEDAQERLTAIMKYFLTKVQRPTKRAIVDALRNPVVNLPLLAEILEAIKLSNTAQVTVSDVTNNKPAVTESPTAISDDVTVTQHSTTPLITPSILDVDDLFDVVDEVHDVVDRWKSLGAALRLSRPVLNRIERDHPNDITSCCEDVISEWLKQSYNTERHGLPTWMMLVDAVAHRNGGNDCALANKIATKYNVAPPSIVSEREDKKLFDQAMLRGYVESSLALLILTGVTGSGKSEFKRLVLGQEVPEFSHSTPLAESAVRSMSMCQAAIKDLKWIVIGPEKMLKMVAKAIIGGLPLWAPNLAEEVKLVAAQDSSLDDIAVTTSGVPPAKKHWSEHHQEGQKQSEEQFTIVMKKINIDSSIHKLMSATEDADLEKLMGVDFIYMLDSGGQPPFREMLPHFVEQASAIVLMQKLNERLDYKPTIRYREEGGKVDKGYTSQLTNEQILHQYVQGIQSHDSKVFVIGTHRDEEDKCDETTEDKNKKLIEAFRPVLGEQMELYKVGNPDQLIFPVNCTSREPDDEAIAREFRKRVMEKCRGKKKEIPMPWFILEQLLHLLAKRIKVSVLSTDECCDAAQRKLLMPRNACEAALRYLGKLNIIFFRPDILPGIVFSNAQVILDKLTELVRCNHALRTEGGNSDAVPSQFHTVKGMKFREYGLLDAKLLKEAFPSHYRKDIFTAQDLLLLLEKMLIAGRLNSGEHFIPSLLPDLPVEKIAEYRAMAATAAHPPPLVIYYPKMWLPVGVMSSLVAYLQNEGHWIPAVENGEPICMYHNCVEFLLPKKKHGDLVLIDSTKFLEVRVRPECKLAPALLHKIKDNVLTGLEKAHESLHYDPPETEIGWLCSGDCGSEKIHLAKLDDDKVSWTCPRKHKVGGELALEQQLWFKNDPAVASKATPTPSSHTTRKKDVLREKPTMRKLKLMEYTTEGAEQKKVLRVLDKISPHWIDIADSLEVDEAVISNAEQDTDQRKSARTVISSWLQCDIDASWSKLKKAMKVVPELNVTRKDLETALLNPVSDSSDSNDDD